MKSFLFRALGGAALLFLGACGGSGGDSADRDLSFTVFPESIAAETIVGESPADAQVLLSLSRQTDESLYIGVSGLGTVINDGYFFDEQPTSVRLALQFRSDLESGEYQDEIAIDFCYDEACTRKLQGSPQRVAIRLVVRAMVLDSVAPSSAPADSDALTLTVYGAGFDGDTRVLWNGSSRETRYVSPYTVSAKLLTADLAVPGTGRVEATSADHAAPMSNALTFAITPPTPFSFNAITPTRVASGNEPFLLTATGTGFKPGVTMLWNGTARETVRVSSQEVYSEISASDIAQLGDVSVSVANPSDTPSQPLVLTVTPTDDRATSYQINAQHSGVIRFPSVTLPLLSSWSVDLGGRPSYSVIADGKVFVVAHADDGNSHLWALDAASGDVAWGPVAIFGSGNPTYENGMLFVGVVSGSAAIRAFDAQTGVEKWTFAMRNYGTWPTAAHGLVFATDWQGLQALDQQTGAPRWSTGAVGAGWPAVAADGVYGSEDCTHAFHPDSRPWWTGKCEYWYGGPVAVGWGALYVQSPFDGTGTQYDARSGAVLGDWIADMPPAIEAERRYFMQAGALTARSADGKTTLWTFTGDGQLVTPPIVVNEYVFVGSSLGVIYAVNAKTGALSWFRSVGGEIPQITNWDSTISSLSAGEGLLVVPAGTRVVAFRLSQ